MKSMISKRHCAVAAAALCLLANALAANTTLPLTIERVANARNILTGSGKADGAPVQDSQNRLIALIAPLESEPPSIAKAARGVDSTVMTAPHRAQPHRSPRRRIRRTACSPHRPA